MSDISREIMDLLERYGADRKQALREHSRLDYLYALSDMRENLLEWYPFHPEGRLLQVGSDYGAMTGLYSRRVAEVVVLDESEDNLAVNRMRHQEDENVAYIRGTLEDYVNQPGWVEMFDYVVFVGSLTPDFDEKIRGAKGLLKPGGELIVAVCNQFGMKYWAGAPKDEYSFSRNTLVRLITGDGEEVDGGDQLEFYYPMPDYKLPISIYSQSYLPGKGDLTNTLTAYDYPKYLLLDIGAAYDAVCEDGQFENYANSFLVIWRKYGAN